MAKFATISERLKQFCDEKFSSQAELARALGIVPQNLTPYLRGDRSPGTKMQNRLRELGCDIEWLMTGKSNLLREPESLYNVKGFAPFIGRVRAGNGGGDFFDDEVPVNAGIPFGDGKKKCFVLQIDSDSMMDDNIMPLDFWLFEEINTSPVNNRVYAFHLKDGRRLVKKLKMKSALSFELHSSNKFRNYPFISIKRSEILSIAKCVMKIQFLDDSDYKRYGLRE